MDPSIRALWHAHAKAAIEGMKIPCADMVIAGNEEIPDNIGYRNDAKAVYVTMIEAALKE